MASLLEMSRRYGVRPSELLSVSDSYTAFCLDEAAAYILGQVETRGELPQVWQQGEAEGRVYKGVKVIDRRRHNKRDS